jgi:hypothetical protein
MRYSDKPPEPPFERLHIDHATNNAPTPRRQRSARQDGPAYWWNAATQELIEILPEDHPQYEQNAQMITAAIRRWNGETK